MTSDRMSEYDCRGRPVIIGAGIAGLMAALHLVPRPVVVISKAALGEQASSRWAQGGLAASFGGEDSPELHLADTIAAGDGLCDQDVARRVTADARAAIEALRGFGVGIDLDADGIPRLGLEAAHGKRRIVHAGGDGTGQEIMRALSQAVCREPSIEVCEATEARSLRVQDGVISGVMAARADRPILFAADQVILATGGIGALFPHTTNPAGSFGQGLAMAARAGAILADLEFIQFHPTAFNGTGLPLPLISEAVRGEGAVVIDETGHRFLQVINGAELAPRDVLARAIYQHARDGHEIYLDGRDKPGAAFADRFPIIWAQCRSAGIDPASQPIPIRPAAHFHMGGIKVDGEGASSVPGLWACGEVACTGLHGANRLASNSLTEAAVFARIIAEALPPSRAGQVTSRRITERVTSGAHEPTDPHVSIPPDPAKIRPLVAAALNIIRDGDSLEKILPRLRRYSESGSAWADPAVIALMIAVSAWRRKESRGAHYRADYPEPLPDAIHSQIRLEEALSAVADME